MKAAATAMYSVSAVINIIHFESGAIKCFSERFNVTDALDTFCNFLLIYTIGLGIIVRKTVTK